MREWLRNLYLAVRTVGEGLYVTLWYFLQTYKRRAFTQHDHTDVLDASLLMMPLVGFVAPRDPMWLSTLDAMDQELVSDSLVYRYDPSASPDGLRGHEGTFSICTFWYVDALARSGRLEQARLAFEKMFTYANHLGLYAEEIGRRARSGITNRAGGLTRGSGRVHA